MAVITRGFGGRRRDDTDLPPGQYRTDDFSRSALRPAPYRTEGEMLPERSPLANNLTHSSRPLSVKYMKESGESKKYWEVP
jgi:hypothetical protein